MAETREIRDYINNLLHHGAFEVTQFTKTFVKFYVDMVPEGEGPKFEPFHRLGTVDDERKKEQNNLKKIQRYLNGEQYIPHVFYLPAIYTLDELGGYGHTLDAKLHRARGYHLTPMREGGDALAVTAEAQKEAAEAHLAAISDAMDDGMINDPRTVEQLNEAIESLEALRNHAQANIDKEAL